MMLIAGIELAEGNSKRGRPTPPDVADVAGTVDPASVASGGESAIPDGGLRGRGGCRRRGSEHGRRSPPFSNQRVDLHMSCKGVALHVGDNPPAIAQDRKICAIRSVAAPRRKDLRCYTEAVRLNAAPQPFDRRLIARFPRG